MTISLSPLNLQSTLSCLPRLPNGGWWTDGTLTQVPALPLHLWEFESCPYCRKAREAFSELDIDYVSHPSGAGSNNRDEVIQRGGKAQFPYLFDPNTGERLYESEAIVDYIRSTYGAGQRPLWRRALGPVNTFGSALASAISPQGGRARDGAKDRTQPAAPLELWQFEMSPYCRKVRQTLTAQNLVFRVHNVAKRGRQRDALVALGGKMQVPYLVDPNTGVSMYESDEIVAYLRATYGH